MKKLKKKQGFTLIEMLVVIAIITILVATVIPTVASATTRAKAGADAANLRSILGEANTLVFGGDKNLALNGIAAEHVTSKSYPEAKMFVVYTTPGFVDVFFVEGTAGDSDAVYYGLDYFTELAETGETAVSTAMPTYPTGYNPEWYEVGAAEPGEGEG